MRPDKTSSSYHRLCSLNTVGGDNYIFDFYPGGNNIGKIQDLPSNINPIITSGAYSDKKELLAARIKAVGSVGFVYDKSIRALFGSLDRWWLAVNRVKVSRMYPYRIWMSLGETSDEPIGINAVYSTFDRESSVKQVWVHHIRTLDKHIKEQKYPAVICEFIRNVAMHEVMEQTTIDGKIWMDPHKGKDPLYDTWNGSRV